MSESRMRLHSLSLIFLLCCVSPSSFVSAIYNFTSPVVGLGDCRPNQIQAFTKFKNEFDTSHCNHSDPYNGVWCDNSTSEITKLQLRACLRGTLKPNSSLFSLHHLRHLDLRQNNFSSSLPSEFGNLNRLEFLSIRQNGFVGQVPSSFNNLSQLSYLSVFQNELTGSFPLLRNLTKLKVLELSHNHFSGSLKPNSSLFELYHLRYLNLGYNKFSSSLPTEFGNLTKLEVLALSYNYFLGQLPPTTSMPSLLHLNLRGNNFSGSTVFVNSSWSSKLKEMDLGYNYFDGQILESISKLINLKWLDLSFFLNTSTYPLDVSLFSSLKSLSYLDLSRNTISPASLGSNSDIPPNLETLVLNGCGISKFPNLLKILEKLKTVYLSDNRITGKVPEWLWKLPRLSAVIIFNNSLNGFQGPAEVMVNSSVKILDVRQNCVEGAIPILPLSIKVFAAQRNRFTGSIPLSICNCSSLTYLTLSFNNLTGPIPRCLSSLTFANFRKNNLEGSIPDEFYVGASLLSLDVGYNRLTGKLPRSLVNCSSLRFISVDNNKIQDTFPFWLKALPKLQVLNLRSNNFFGPISPSDQGSLGFPELWILEISDNMFSGSLSPRYFENWKASSLLLNEDGKLYMEYKESIGGIMDYVYINTMDLRYKGLSTEQQKVSTFYAAIDFSGNKLEGQIPESIGLLKALITLNLSNNAFTGHIPLSCSNLSKLETLDISRNQLSGTIPSGLRSLTFLAYINVSHNQLRGEIPQGTQITGQPKSSFEGNKGLCGLPLQDTCFDTHAPPTQQPEDQEEEEEEEEEVLNWKAVAIGCGPGVLLGLAIGQVFASYKPEWSVKILVSNKRINR